MVLLVLSLLVPLVLLVQSNSAVIGAAIRAVAAAVVAAAAAAAVAVAVAVAAVAVAVAVAVADAVDVAAFSFISFF